MGARPRGPQRAWRPKSPRAQGILADLIARYQQHNREGTLPRGGRGIFYDLRPNGMGNGVTYRKPDSAHPLSGFGPMEAHPAAVQEVLVMARRAGIIPEAWVADTRAPNGLTIRSDESAASVADSIAWWAQNAAGQFRLDLQLHQDQYVELWCEAGDLAPRVAQMSRSYGVPVYSGAGFDGLKGKIAVASRAVGRDRPTVVLHIGDRDPHGEMIFEAISEDAGAWAASMDRGEGGGVEFRRLALTEDQAEEFGLLDADGKAEADSLPVDVLDGIVTRALDGLFDEDARARMRADEAEQRRLMPDLIRVALADAGLLGGDDE
jgi:hypothetical protein